MKNHIPSYNDFVNESINEGSDVDPRVKKEAISKLSDFFRVSPNALSHLKFDGKDPIKDVTKSLNATSYEGAEQYYRVAIQMAKRDLGIHESIVNEGVKSDVQKLLSKIDDELYNIIKWKDAASCYVSTPADAKDIIDAVKSKYPKSSWNPKTNLLVFESIVNEGAVKAFEKDYKDMETSIKRGIGWIEPDYVEETWENSSDTIDFDIVKDELYNRLIKAGLLYTSEDGETKDKKITNISQIK